MKVSKTSLDGVLVLEPVRHSDARGFFSEIWNGSAFERLGINVSFVQDNQSLSIQKGTVRGLHFQAPPHAQAKLVRCGRGKLFDVAVDIRVGSPYFGQWFGTELSFENGRQMLIPEGFLHGFITRAPNTEIIYKCSDYYVPELEGAVRFDDSDIGIDWGVAADSVFLSPRDARARSLRDLQSPFLYRA